MILRSFVLPAALIFLAACAETTPPVEEQRPTTAGTSSGPKVQLARSTKDGKASFDRVSKRLLPVARQACRAKFKSNAATKCKFRLIVRNDQGSSPDAKFTRSASGRPIIVFNSAMLQFLRDDDEMAMVLGHEMAHQIGNHIERGQREVLRSAINGAKAAKKAGGDAQKAAVTAAENALISFSRKFELEADKAGTILMMQAGYTPDKAINLLDRLPSGNSRFRRHPLHPQRKQAVRSVAKQFRAAQASGQTLALAF